MSDDYWGRQPPKRTSGVVWMTVFVILCGVAFTVVTYLHKRPANLAQADAWDIRAEPCPEVTKEAFMAQPVRIKSQIEFSGLTVGRAFGHIECEDVSYGGWRTWSHYPACQLTGPGVLTVKRGGKETYYLPGFGRRTTIRYADGELKCVLDGKFGKMG